MKCPLTFVGPITLSHAKCACVVVKVLRKYVVKDEIKYFILSHVLLSGKVTVCLYMSH